MAYFVRFKCISYLVLEHLGVVLYLRRFQANSALQPSARSPETLGGSHRSPEMPDELHRSPETTGEGPETNSNH